MPVRRRRTVRRNPSYGGPFPGYTRTLYRAHAKVNDATLMLARALAELDGVIEQLPHYALDAKSRRLVTLAKKARTQTMRSLRSVEDGVYACLDAAEYAASLAGEND